MSGCIYHPIVFTHLTGNDMIYPPFLTL